MIQAASYQTVSFHIGKDVASQAKLVFGELFSATATVMEQNRPIPRPVKYVHDPYKLQECGVSRSHIPGQEPFYREFIGATELDGQHLKVVYDAKIGSGYVTSLDLTEAQILAIIQKTRDKCTNPKR